MVKNDTRIASLNGAWTVDLRLKTDVGGASMRVWYSFNLMCDPLIQNEALGKCTNGSVPITGECDSLHRNEICMRELDDGGVKYNYTCGSMQNNQTDWSDQLMMYHLGLEIDIPGFYLYDDTGDFIGAFSLVLPQPDLDMYTKTHEARQGERIIDVYQARYLNSVYSDKIYRPENCSIFSASNFEAMGGKEALNYTIEYQTLPEEVDIYAPYYNTCENGDAHPTLPIMRYEFSRSNVFPFTETIDIVFSYHLFVAPKMEDTKNWEKAKDLGFPISGPYCYEGELRGYTVDMDFDSKKGSDYVQYEHACIEGDPCLSKAYERCSLCSDIEVRESNGGTTIQIGVVIWLILSITMLSAFFCCSFISNWRNRKLINQLETEMNVIRESDDDNNMYSLLANNDQTESEEDTPETTLLLTHDPLNPDDDSLVSDASHPLKFKVKEEAKDDVEHAPNETEIV